MSGAVDWRGALLTGLITGLIWLAFYGQPLWMDALGIRDFPGAELYVLGLLIVFGLGLIWSQPVASLAAGVGGFVGLLVAVTVSGTFQDYFDAGSGFDAVASAVQFLVVPCGAHVLGAAFGQLLRRPAESAMDAAEPMP
jgi:hypothetical protein